MDKRRYSGRFLLFWGALGLLAFAGYEFVVRMETIWWALKGVYRLSVHEGFSFFRALTFFDASMFELVGFLLGCVVYSVLVICLRNRPRAGYLMIALGAGLGVLGGPVLHLFGLSILHWNATLKLIPLLVVLIGCVVNLSQYYAARRRRRARRRGWADERGIDGRVDNREMAQEVRRRRNQGYIKAS